MTRKILLAICKDQNQLISYFFIFSGRQSVCPLDKRSILSRIRYKCYLHDRIHQLWWWRHHNFTQDWPNGSNTRSPCMLQRGPRWSARNWFLARKNQILPWCSHTQEDFSQRQLPSESCAPRFVWRWRQANSKFSPDSSYSVLCKSTIQCHGGKYLKLTCLKFK